MKKIILATFAALTAFFSFAADGDKFETTYDFENDADFVGVSTMPAGWSSTGVRAIRRYKAEVLGMNPAPSGEYVIGNIGALMSEVLATPIRPVKAGEEYTLQFSYFAASQNPDLGYGFKIWVADHQSVENAFLLDSIEADPARPAEWIRSKVFTFVPKVDYDLCFIVTPYNSENYSPGGAIGFDDVVITGTEGTPDYSQEEEYGDLEDFELTADFDLDADFSNGATLPAGWASEGSPIVRRQASYFGIPAHSGDYVLATAAAAFDEVIYTPLVKLPEGLDVTLSFHYYLPGGSNAVYSTGVEIYFCPDGQSMENAVKIGKIEQAKYSGWQPFEISAKPAANGPGCFALRPVNDYGMKTNCGVVAFDSFTISGYRFMDEKPDVPDFPVVELTPNPAHEADCMDLPYEENFSEASHYSGDNVPAGWLTTGACSFVTANVDALKAHSGTWYLVANHNSTWERDDIAYTPFFNLEGGREYTLNFWVFMQGNDWNEEGTLTLPALHCTVGTEQSPEAHNRLGYFTQKTTGWVEQNFSFIPEISGPYCFAFMLTGLPNTGYVFIDDVRISAPGSQYKVEAGFMVRGVYSMFDQNATITFPGHQIEMVNTSRYAESYKWSAPGARPSESTDVNPRFTFPNEGPHTITLTATNARGSRTTQRTINVMMMDQVVQGDMPLTLYNAAQDETIGRGSVPAYASDTEGDFVTGFNHYYFKVAQRFDFSPDMTVNLKQLQFFVTDRRYAEISVYGPQNQMPFSLVVYGSDSDGNLDETKVLGRVDTTVGDAVGGSGLGGYSPDPRDIAFDEPVAVRGTFYLAMEFDPAMEVVAQDTNIGRSYFASAAMKHGHGLTTLYGKLIDRPEGCDAKIGDWVTIDKLDPEMAGLGAFWTLWCSTFEAENSIESLTSDGTPTFAATVTGSTITLTGLTPGLPIEVYSYGGHLLRRFTPATTTAILPALHCLIRHNNQTVKQ